MDLMSGYSGAVPRQPRFWGLLAIHIGNDIIDNVVVRCRIGQ